MNLKANILSNFEKVLTRLNFTKTSNEDILCTISYSELLGVLGLKNIDRGSLIKLSNAWCSLTDSLPYEKGVVFYNALAQNKAIDSIILGYNNLYLKFVNELNVFNTDKCTFSISCTIRGHLGGETNIYCRGIYGSVIDANEYEAYFETKDNVLDFLGHLSFDCKSVGDHSCKIFTTVSLNTLRGIDKSATLMDFNCLGGALKDAYMDVINAQELLDAIQCNLYEAESRDGKLISFETKYDNQNNEKVLRIIVTKEFY